MGLSENNVGTHHQAMNSPLTPVRGLRAHRRAIVVHFVVRRKISYKAIWDFFDSIGQKRQFAFCQLLPA
jgi:hypothetical protein